MSSFLYFVFSIMCTGFAAGEGARIIRSSGSGSSSSSSSSSFSSSSSGSGGFGGTSNFMFPQNNFNAFPNQGGLPFQDFNALYQQFLSNLNAAQAYAQHNPSYASLFQQQIANLIAQQQAAMAQIPFAFPNVNSIPHGSGGGYGGNYGGNYGGGAPSGVHTGASINYGSQGGYGQASAFPGGPDGLGVRIAEELPAPSGGGSFGVFTSSSSGTSDVNGKRTSFKTSTFGTNDNGKITFKTINE